MSKIMEEIGQRYLRRLDDGYVYPFTKALSKRVSEFVLCDKNGRRLDMVTSDETPVETVEIEVDNKLFSFPEHLVSVVESLKAAVSSKEEGELEQEVATLTGQLNAALKEKNRLTKIKLTLESASGDLQKKLSDSMKEVSEMKKAGKKVQEDMLALKNEIKSLKK